MKQHIPATSLRSFGLICFGQLISLIGSGITGWALGIWTYQQTGSSTQFALISLSTVLPGIALSPIAGVLVDRWDRRIVMILGDTCAGLSTLLLALLFTSGQLEIWHIYLVMAFSSTCSAFHWPAYMASIPLLVPERHLGRASGLAQAGHGAALVLSPLLAGVLLATAGMEGLMAIDVVTFICAVTTLLVVRIPAPPVSKEGQQQHESLLGEVAYGWSYLRAQPGLLALLMLFGCFNFLAGMIDVLVVPLFLSVATPAIGGMMMGVSGTGMLAGTFAIAVWGGPRRSDAGILGFMLCSGVCLILMGVQPSLWTITIGGWGFVFCIPLINGIYQTMLHRSIAPDLQGRIFAVSRMVAESTLPIAYIVAGPLADRIGEPALAPGGLLAESFGPTLGVGPGRGVALIFVVTGICIMAVAIRGYFTPQLRLIKPFAWVNTAAEGADTEWDDQTAYRSAMGER